MLLLLFPLTLHCELESDAVVSNIQEECSGVAELCVEDDQRPERSLCLLNVPFIVL